MTVAVAKYFREQPAELFIPARSGVVLPPCEAKVLLSLYAEILERIARLGKR
jgi:hypothetical protein